MILEQLIFTVLAFGIFVYMFFKMFKENDTNYIGILIIEAIGISLNFVEVLKRIEFGPFWTIIKYILAILTPIAIMILDKKQIPLIHILSVVKAKFYLKLGNNKKAKEQLINLVSKYPENYIGHKMLAEIYELEGGMRKAIDELCAEGILYRIKGKGCFVRELADQKRSRIYSFTEAVRNEGKLPGKKQLSLEKKEADAYLADKLQIEEGEEIFEIRSLYYADGIPFSLNTAVLPAKRFEKLDFFDFNNRSLYEVLGSFYGTYMYRVRQTLEATTADVSVSRLLERDESQPLLRIKAISYCLEDNQEIPVEYYEAYILTDIQNYYVEKFH